MISYLLEYRKEWLLLTLGDSGWEKHKSLEEQSHNTANQGPSRKQEQATAWVHIHLEQYRRNSKQH